MCSFVLRFPLLFIASSLGAIKWLEDFGKTDNTLENWGYIADKYNIEKTFENLSKIEKIKSELQQIKKASIWSLFLLS